MFSSGQPTSHAKRNAPRDAAEKSVAQAERARCLPVRAAGLPSRSIASPFDKLRARRSHPPSISLRHPCRPGRRARPSESAARTLGGPTRLFEVALEGKHCASRGCIRPILVGLLVSFFFLLFIGEGERLSVRAASLSDFEATLREQVRQLTEEINKYGSEISNLQKEAKTLKRDISIIDAQINKAELEIQARKLAIQELTEQIGDKQAAIAAAEERIVKRRSDLERSIRVLNERASDSPLTAILRHSHLAGYFDELASLEQLYQSIESDIREIKVLKADLEAQRRDLEDEQNEQVALQQAQELQRQDALRRETDKKRILSEAKGKESNFQKLAKEGREKLAVLQQQLYLLDTQGSVLTIEQARSMATRIANAVSIRPVFLLGVLKVESDLGRNVGRGTWTKDMSPKERPVFQTLMERLGLDPNQVPVSKKPWYGWGGAMGLAQFIPSTWVAYEAAISAVTGHVPPSPWNAEDAFTAAATKLSRDGATAQTPEAERKAAQIYFAGSNWNKPSYAFYGDRVMDLAGQFAEAFAIADSGGSAVRL